MTTTIHIAWCHDTSLAAQIVALFLDNLDANYISHSELQYGRANTHNTWSHDLPKTIRDDVAAALSTSPDTAHVKLATAMIDGVLAGIAFVSVDTEKSTATPFATLEDLVVSPASRGKGIGQKMLDWITLELRAQGIQRLFLESGNNNHNAHHFFEQQGFTQISIVMMKDLS